MKKVGLLIGALTIGLGLFCGGQLSADQISYTPIELFRVYYGQNPDQLKMVINEGDFGYPEGFTMDLNKHFYFYDQYNSRIVKFTKEGRFAFGISYPKDEDLSVFAHGDSRGNIWLLFGKPRGGVYYQIYDDQGHILKQKSLSSAFNNWWSFQDQEGEIHLILQVRDFSKGANQVSRVISEEEYQFNLDELSLEKPDPIHANSIQHLRILAHSGVYFLKWTRDSSDSTKEFWQVEDSHGRKAGEIKPAFYAIDKQGDVYVWGGRRKIRILDIVGNLKKEILMSGYSSSFNSLNFDVDGNIYQMDRIPNRTDAQLNGRVPPVDSNDDKEDLHYDSDAPGVRIIKWERK